MSVCITNSFGLNLSNFIIITFDLTQTKCNSMFLDPVNCLYALVFVEEKTKQGDVCLLLKHPVHQSQNTWLHFSDANSS